MTRRYNVPGGRKRNEVPVQGLKWKVLYKDKHGNVYQGEFTLPPGTLPSDHFERVMSGYTILEDELVKRI